MVLETHVKLYVTESDFSGKKCLPPKLEKWTKNGPETLFFLFLFFEKILLNLCYNENFYLLCSWTNFVPGIWAKMCSANEITGFFNPPYLQNKLIK